MIEMIHESSTDFDMWLYDSVESDRYRYGLQPENVESNGIMYGGTTVYLQSRFAYSSRPWMV